MEFHDRLLPNQSFFSQEFNKDIDKFYKSLYDTIMDSCNISYPKDEFTLETDQEHTIEAMASSPVNLRFFEMVVLLTKPKNILEIGTFIGLSSLYLSKYLPEGGKVTTLEKFDRFAKIAQNNIEKNSAEDKIELIVGDAFETIQEFDKNRTFDMIFLDGNKELYLDYFKFLDPYLNSGGVFIVDDVLFHGDVLNEEPNTFKGKGVKMFVEYLKDNDNYHRLILPISNGIAILIKK